MRTFRSFVRIPRMRDVETMALKIREVRRDRRVSEMVKRLIDQNVQPQPVMRRRNSVNGPVDAIPVDQNFIAHLRQLGDRNRMFFE